MGYNVLHVNTFNILCAKASGWSLTQLDKTNTVSSVLKVFPQKNLAKVIATEAMEAKLSDRL